MANYVGAISGNLFTKKRIARKVQRREGGGKISWQEGKVEGKVEVKVEGKVEGGEHLSS